MTQLQILQINNFYPKFLQTIFEMGSTMQKVQAIDLSYYAPPLQQYRLAHCGSNYYVWDHCLQDDSLIQFPINILNEHALKQYIDTYLFRHRHHLFVSTLYFRRNQQTGKGSIFYERVFTNLARIKDIPFADSLQFYYVAFKGFELLYKKFGYFQVEEEMFHITKNNKVKIWCHKDISKEKPKPMVQESLRGTQSDMVKRIIRIIQQNSDHSGSNFPVGAEIYEKASTSFAAAIQKLRQICFREKFGIPDKLTCLEAISKGDVGALLDQYGPDSDQNQIKPQHGALNDKPLANLALFAIQTNNPNHKPQSVPPIRPYFDQNQLINTRNMRKGKGLQVSHSLERLKQDNRNCFSNIRVNHVAYPPDRIFNSPIKQLDDQTTNFNMIKINGIPCQAPQQNYNQTISFNPQPPFPNPRHSFTPQVFHNVQPIQSRPNQITRSNSFDNIGQSQSSKNKTQYRIVINQMDRPTSNIVPKENTPLQNIQRPPLNNFLNPRLITISPSPLLSPPLPSQATKFQQLNEVPPQSQYRQNQNNMLHPIFSPNLNSYKVGLAKNQMVQMPEGIPQLKYRSTFISDLSEIDYDQQSVPFKDQSNLKTRFQQYKKNFNFNKSSAKENHSLKSDLKGCKYHTKLQKPFFGGILNSETVNSYLESYGNTEKHSEVQKISQKSIKNETNEFPSITDVSDNISSFPNKEKHFEDKPWREQSVVVKHDPNQPKMQMPGMKKYSPDIDGEIWADMLKARNRAKLGKSQI